MQEPTNIVTPVIPDIPVKPTSKSNNSKIFIALSIVALTAVIIVLIVNQFNNSKSNNNLIATVTPSVNLDTNNKDTASKLVNTEFSIVWDDKTVIDDTLTITGKYTEDTVVGEAPAGIGIGTTFFNEDYKLTIGISNDHFIYHYTSYAPMKTSDHFGDIFSAVIEGEQKYTYTNSLVLDSECSLGEGYNDEKVQSPCGSGVIALQNDGNSANNYSYSIECEAISESGKSICDAIVDSIKITGN
jgi:hypothetical protein